MRSIDLLMNPRSIAIIGASSDKTRIGGRPVRYLIESGFAGDVYPINPARDEVQGLRAYPSVEDVPGRVDCAVLATPTDAILPAVQACARKGVGGLVILTAGFAEMGSAGARLQNEILAVARAHDMRILGPNCLGMFNTANRAFLTFSGVFDDVVGTSGRLALVSQSGGYAGELVKLAKSFGLDFGSWITTGNEADIEAGEVIGAFADDPNIDVILAYLEGSRSRDSLIAGLEAARAKRKPVILLKVGRTEQGALAAAAHTASLSGSDAVYDAVFNRYGAYRARSTEEMLDIAYAASRGVFPSGNRLVILTGSGGIGVQAADFAQDEGLELPPLTDQVKTAILEMVPNAGTHNPIDLTGALAHHLSLYSDALDLTLGSGQYDLAYLNIGVLAGLPHAAQPLLDLLAKSSANFPTVPKVVAVMAPPDIVAGYEKAGFLSFVEPARALRALAGLHRIAAGWERRLPDAGIALAVMPRLAIDTALSEAAAKRLLAQAGIGVPEEHVVHDPAAAIDAARRIGRNVAIKVVSADLLHKSDVGGVALDIAPEDAGTVVGAMAETVRRHAPTAVIDGYLITPMYKGGVECFIGVRRDPVFGPVIVFGLGGVAVELYRDVTTRVAPIDLAEAHDMIASTRGAALLNGYRGRPKADVAALAETIVRVSALASANVESVGLIEINPLLVLDEGQGVVALDAVITV